MYFLRWCCRVAIWPPSTFLCSMSRSTQFLSAKFLCFGFASTNHVARNHIDRNVYGPHWLYVVLWSLYEVLFTLYAVHYFSSLYAVLLSLYAVLSSLWGWGQDPTGIWVRAYRKATMQWAPMLMIRHFVSSARITNIRHPCSCSPLSSVELIWMQSWRN